MGLRAGLDRCGNLAATRIPSPKCPAHSESLYRLHYLGSNDFTVLHHNHLVSNAATEGTIRMATLVNTAFTLLYHHYLFTSALSVLLLIPPLSCLPILMLKIFSVAQSLPTKEAV